VSYKWPFWLFVSVEKIRLVECLRWLCLISPFWWPKTIVYLRATCLRSLSDCLYGAQMTPQYSKSWTLWCSVNSSTHVWHSLALMQSDGGDHLGGYESHQNLYSVSRYVELGFDLAGQLVPMPGTAYSLPRTSVLLTDILLLWDVGLLCPLWV